MNKKLENKFLQIIEDAMEYASSVDCILEDYVEGLEIMVEELQDRLAMAREELANKEDTNEN